MRKSKKQAVKAAKAKTSLPDGLSRDLSRILRPQAAYRWLLPQLAAITPQYIEMTLRGVMAGSHVQGWELFDLMEDTSPRLMKNINEVKRAVVGLDWKLWPYQEEDAKPTNSALEKARLIGAALRRMHPDPTADENDFNGMLYDILDAWTKGQSVSEVDWEMRETPVGSTIVPRTTYWVHPTCYAWTMQGKLGLRMELTPGNQGGYALSPGVWQSTTQQPLPSQVADFPPDKFLISICKGKSGTALGGALLRPLAWWWCAANFSADWLMNLAQLFGLPFRWANYDPSAPQATIDAICAMLQNMGHEAWAAFPAGTTLELKEAGKAGDASPQCDLLDRAEKQMDLLILGQTLTTDVSKQGGSRALGDVHAGVKEEIVQAAGNWSAGILNTQLIPSILRQNFGDDSEAPEYRPVPRKEEDSLADAQRDQVLLAAGMEMPKVWFYDRHKVPMPESGEETIGGASGPSGLPTGGLPPQAGEEPDQDAPPEQLDAKSPVSAGLVNSGIEHYAAALASDMEHVRALVAGLRDITDDRVLAQKAIEVMGEIERLRADMLKMPKSATALAEVMAPAFLNGLTEDVHRTQVKGKSGAALQAGDFSEDAHPRAADGKFTYQGAIGKHGTWQSLGLPHAKDLPADKAADEMDPREAEAILRAGKTIQDHAGRPLHFGAGILDHWDAEKQSAGEKDRRLRHLGDAFATGEQSREQWDRNWQRNYLRVTQDAKLKRRYHMGFVADSNGMVRSFFHTHSPSQANGLRKGTLSHGRD